MKVKIRFKSVKNDAEAYTSFSAALLKIDLSSKQINQALSKLSQARDNFSNLSKYEIAGKTPTFGIPGGSSFDVVKQAKEEVEACKKAAIADLEKAITTLKSL